MPESHCPPRASVVASEQKEGLHACWSPAKLTASFSRVCYVVDQEDAHLGFSKGN
jgi:hypothetical protein